MSIDSLINKYRPAKFSQVVGQPQVVDSFRTVLKEKTSHAFLFSGIPGSGKTTLSRLGAEFCGSFNSNIIEIDAPTYSGADDFRGLTESLKYRPLGGTVKSVIVDECQALSKQAWQVALKMVEEPPEWVRWFFCTTDIAKVPEAIKANRCTCYTLNPVRISEVLDYLIKIVKAEGFTTPNTIIELCAKQSGGSIRRALSNLSVCYAVDDRREAAQLILAVEVEEGGSPFLLAKALADGFKWDKIQPILTAISISEINAETVRHTVRAYFTTMILSNKDEKSVCRALAVLDHFSEPYNSSDGLSPLLVSVGRSLF